MQKFDVTEIDPAAIGSLKVTRTVLACGVYAAVTVGRTKSRTQSCAVHT
jgi:hypothetical protein